MCKADAQLCYEEYFGNHQNQGVTVLPAFLLLHPTLRVKEPKPGSRISRTSQSLREQQCQISILVPGKVSGGKSGDTMLYSFLDLYPTARRESPD